MINRPVARIIFCLFLALVISCAKNRVVTGWKSGPLKDGRVLQTAVPIDAIEAVEITGNAGRCIVTADDRSEITVNVEVGVASGRASEETDAYIADAEVESTVRGGILMLEVEPSRHVDNIEERWAVTVPRRMAVRVDMTAANIDVTGARGGTKVNVTTGNVRVDAESGDVEVDVEVGDAVVVAYGFGYETVKVESSVGGTSLSVGGYEMDYDDDPGPGSRIGLRGEGSGRVRVKVGVGDAKLAIESSKRVKE